MTRCRNVEKSTMARVERNTGKHGTRWGLRGDEQELADHVARMTDVMTGGSYKCFEITLYLVGEWSVDESF